MLDVLRDVREALGCYADCYDVAAIASRCYEWRGNRMVATETWQDEESFWDTACRFSLSAPASVPAPVADVVDLY